jgi:hypothetical protein
MVASARSKTAPPGAGDTVTAIPALTGSGMVLTLDSATVTALKGIGATVAPEGTATLVDNSAAVRFPITSGYAEVHSDHSFKPGYLLGSIEQYGSGLTISTSSVTVAATDFVVDLGESMIYATMGSTEDIPLFSLQSSGLAVTTSGDTLRIGPTEVDVTPTGAAYLNAVFHTTAITPYTEIGMARITATGAASQYAYTTATTEIPRLSGIATTVALSAAALGVLRRVGATPSANGSATYTAGAAEIGFPITGGTAVVHSDRRGQPGYLEGVVLHEGSGLTLTRGSTSVAMTDFTLEPGTSSVYASVNGGPNTADLFKVDDARVRVSAIGGNFHVSGAELVLTVPAATMLDGVFATADFKAGLELGALSLVASGR